jgi:hypothetical protein
MLIGSGLQALATSGKFKPVAFGQIRTAGDTRLIRVAATRNKRGITQAHRDQFSLSRSRQKYQQLSRPLI